MKRAFSLFAVVFLISFPAFSSETNKVYKSISWEEFLLSKEEFLNKDIEIKGYGKEIDNEGFTLAERTQSSNSIFVNMVKIKRESKETIVNKYNGKMKISVKGKFEYDNINDRYQIVVDYLMY